MRYVFWCDFEVRFLLFSYLYAPLQPRAIAGFSVIFRGTILVRFAGVSFLAKNQEFSYLFSYHHPYLLSPRHYWFFWRFFSDHPSDHFAFWSDSLVGVLVGFFCVPSETGQLLVSTGNICK